MADDDHGNNVVMRAPDRVSFSVDSLICSYSGPERQVHYYAH